MNHGAGWHADPFGRFEYRYWNGVQWTEHVSRGGQTSVDAPVASPPPPPMPPPPAPPPWPVTPVPQTAWAAPAAVAQPMPPVTMPSPLDYPVLMFKEHFTIGDYRTDFSVYDEANNQVAGVTQVNQRALDGAIFNGQDMSSGAHGEMEIRDQAGNLILYIIRPRTMLRSTMFVNDAHGREIGRFCQKKVLRFHATIESGGRQWGEMRFAGRTAKAIAVKDHTGTEIARVERFVQNLATLIFTDKDNMRLRVHQPLAEPLRSLVFCAPILVEAAMGHD